MTKSDTKWHTNVIVHEIRYDLTEFLPPMSLATLKPWQVIYSLILWPLWMFNIVACPWYSCPTMLDHAEFSDDHACQEQLWLFLVSLLIISQQLHNLLNKLFPTNFMATSGTMFCLDIQMYMTDSGGCRLHNTVSLGEHNEH